ncbi:MAG: hypothetical protein PHR06_05315 [Candidatus Cloacimonetes bacterium]|nr:hypothetical protein [Candidatus Cloacimonadota bacterium]
MSQRDKYYNIKSKLWTILTTSTRKNKWSIVDDVIIYGIVLLNTILVGLNSFKSLSVNQDFRDYFEVVTLISIIVLILNYLLCLWSSTSQKVYSSPIKGRVLFLLSPFSLLDLIVILPVFFFGVQANLIFLLLIKMFKITGYFGEEDEYSPASILKRSFLNKKEELLITILLSTGLLLLCSYAIFYFESKAQPEAFEDIIPSLGWVFSVLTGTPLYDYTPITLTGKVLHIIMVLLGVVIVGLPVGILTGSFVEEISESKKIKTIRQNGRVIINAFKHEQKINVRKIIKDLKLPEERKSLDIDLAVARLEFSQEEILQAVRFSPNLRIRACRQNTSSTFEDNLIIECFPVNTSYGSFIDRGSKIHIISCQSVGEMSIGHFTRLLSEYLGANYYSNEFFSSANLIEEKQINFAENELYAQKDTKNVPVPLLEWKETLLKNIKPGDLAVYFTATSNENSEYHILCGGKKGVLNYSEVENPTVDNVARVESFYHELNEKINEFGYKASTHEFGGNTKKYHLTKVIRQFTDSDVIMIQLNKNLLEVASLEIYFKNIWVLAETIKNKLEPSGQNNAS